VHTIPQPPQFEEFVDVFTHVPLQFVVPLLQQAPDEQTWLPVQLFPHAPQLLVLLERFTHVPLQFV
jgi:hypothetical protein